MTGSGGAREADGAPTVDGTGSGLALTVDGRRLRRRLLLPSYVLLLLLALNFLPLLPLDLLLLLALNVLLPLDVLLLLPLNVLLLPYLSWRSILPVVYRGLGPGHFLLLRRPRHFSLLLLPLVVLLLLPLDLLLLPSDVLLLLLALNVLLLSLDVLLLLLLP